MKIILLTLLRTFIHPFQDWRRSATFFGIILGCFGFSLVNVTSAYDLGGEGLWSLLSYFMPALLFSGFVLWPLLYLGFSTIDSLLWRVFILIAQTLTLALFLNWSHEPLIQGFAAAILMAPFWTAFHIAMVQNTTANNRGFEVSLAGLLGGSGSILGTVAYGLLVSHGLATAAVIIALIAMLSGTILLLLASQRQINGSVQTFMQEAQRIMSQNPQLMKRLASLGLFDAPGFTMAALMHTLNFSVATISAILASRILSEFLLTPLVGHLAHNHRNKGFKIGVTIIGLAWLFLCLSPQNALAFLIFLISSAMGSKVAGNSVNTALYETQTYASMMLAEFLLAVGRGLGLLLLLPILYFDSQSYMLAVVITAAGLFFIDGRFKHHLTNSR